MQAFLSLKADPLLPDLQGTAPITALLAKTGNAGNDPVGVAMLLEACEPDAAAENDAFLVEALRYGASGLVERVLNGVPDATPRMGWPLLWWAMFYHKSGTSVER